MSRSGAVSWRWCRDAIAGVAGRVVFLFFCRLPPPKIFWNIFLFLWGAVSGLVGGWDVGWFEGGGAGDGARGLRAVGLWGSCGRGLFVAAYAEDLLEDVLRGLAHLAATV